jgi:hypothetical protein
VLDQVEREEERLSAWRRVLEQTTQALLRGQGARGGTVADDEAAT